MARETKYTGIMGDLQRLSVTMDANKEELPHLEPFRLKLGGILTSVLEVSQEQFALKARKQETSKRLRNLFTEGQRLANVVRAAVKEHYGVREEKVAEFGVQPFRGRKSKAAPEKPAPPAPQPAAGGGDVKTDR
jgi:hypothetical protein